jgi:CRISPR/Cas system CMR subunit Cmr4 (Cas7 group RAMP superfamily)
MKTENQNELTALVRKQRQMSDTTMSQKNQLRVPPVQMRAVIISDDLVFAATAATSLARVGHQTGVNVQWSIKCWPVNVLNDTALAEKALVETLDAHLILFPARSAQSVPSWVCSWLERWAAQRRIQTAALGVINDSTEPTTEVDPELSRIIRQHDLSFIIDEERADQEPMKVRIDFSSERTVPLPIEPSRSMDLAMRNSFRGYGINE